MKSVERKKMQIMGLAVMALCLMSWAARAQDDTVAPLPVPEEDQTMDMGNEEEADSIFDDAFGISMVPSQRNDNAVDQDPIGDRVPLAYQNIRPQDAIWGKRVWEEIDTRQKMNLTFTYPGFDSEGNSLTLINILLKAAMDGEVTAFSANDDRFTTPLEGDQLETMVHGEAETLQIVDPITGEETDTTIFNDFDPNSVSMFRLKEDWIFDKQTSRLYNRIIGIAPLRTVYNEDGSVRAQTPMFWMYYPDLRPVLAQYEVYNSKNYYQRLSWEDLFEMRFFSANIVKEDNYFDRSLKEEIPDSDKDAGIKRLLRGQEIHDKIFDYEQNLWEY